MKPFPRISPQGPVAEADRVSAIDFVNRVNWWFETWDVESMIDAFTPDAVAFHFHGTIRNHAGIRHFFEHDYPYLIAGVARVAGNHIVDNDGDGVVVRYQNLLVRYVEPEGARALGAGQMVERQNGLPGIWLYSPMMDRLRRTADGWKIHERYIGGTTTNALLSPADHSAAAAAPFLPELG
ncbi:ketosteroid isomerase-like protein [Luteibacter sp. W1I16]|jgi:ketosteroid isomerase-like protein|uniref:nuclear transport factor 2 family protein n=1 Tax=Luteibacter sp. W1I16 TaxID=3373922 RepID=UPI003D1FFE44